MRVRPIDIKKSVGRILMSPISSGGKRLLAKGHRIDGQDVEMLQAGALNDVWVAELEEGETDEDEAVLQLADKIGCGSLEIRPAGGGKANLFTTEPCCVLVDSALLAEANSGDGLVIATYRNF